MTDRARLMNAGMFTRVITRVGITGNPHKVELWKEDGRPRHAIRFLNDTGPIRITLYPTLEAAQQDTWAVESFLQEGAARMGS